MSIETDIRALDARIKGIEEQKSSMINDYKARMTDFENEISGFRKKRLGLMERSIIYGEH